MNEELIHRVGVWIGRWIGIAEAIVVILSFTYYIPGWEFQWMTLRQKAKINRMIAQRDKEGGENG
jgi:hypothetical protein